MSEQPAGAGDGDPVLPRTPRPGSVTRGFLFADLRAYTAYVEMHGAVAAASMLTRYRNLVRGAVDRFGGAEIRTEGDSFYVVFDSVSTAVRCGLAIASEAEVASREHPDEPIRVGIGIHAGETIETADRYVGSPVNTAARICAEAAPGEVLVSETVRALTHTVLPVRFESRGRRQLKGIADRAALFSVVESAPGAGPWADGRRRPIRAQRPAILGGGVILLAIAVAGVGWWTLRPPAGLPPGDWRIGLDMPLTGSAAFRGLPVRDAVQLAIDDANAGGGILGTTLGWDVYDDAGDAPNGQDGERGADNARTMAADPKTLAIIGPWGSSVAYSMIPVTNEAGLLQCSPANTLPELTKRRYGALDLRSAHPEAINYIRLAPADDIQAPALASFAFRDLGVEVALVIDDTDVGRDIADGFAAEYGELGGRVVRRAMNPGADPIALLAPLTEEADPPGVVFFGGFSDTGAPELRSAMIAAGHGSLPFLSWDGLFDGSGAEAGSYIQRAGSAAVGSTIAHASVPLPKASFVQSYRDAYGKEPDEFSAAAYACVELIVEGLRAVASTGPSPEALREALRAYVVDESRRYETVLGTVGLDGNGDSVQPFVTFYRVDPSAAGGMGDWVIVKQQDFGPAP